MQCQGGRCRWLLCCCVCVRRSWLQTAGCCCKTACASFCAWCNFCQGCCLSWYHLSMPWLIWWKRRSQLRCPWWKNRCYDSQWCRWCSQAWWSWSQAIVLALLGGFWSDQNLMTDDWWRSVLVQGRVEIRECYWCDRFNGGMAQLRHPSITLWHPHKTHTTYTSHSHSVGSSRKFLVWSKPVDCWLWLLTVDCWLLTDDWWLIICPCSRQARPYRTYNSWI